MNKIAQTPHNTTRAAAPLGHRTHFVPRSELTNREASGVTSQDVFVPPQPPAGGDPNIGPRTALQKHVDFFDGNGDGKIKLSETYRGLRDLGFGRVSSGTFATLINLGLGRGTGGGTLTVDVNNIHKGKHPGDSDAFDESGRFIKKHAQVVEKHDTNGDQRLSYGELWTMIKGKKEGGAGMVAAAGEWLLLNFLAGEKSPQTGEKSIDQASVNQFYDGSLFHEIAARNAAK
jgi:peroxygenase